MTTFRCNRCSKNAIYFRKRDGIYLCDHCLKAFLKKKVERYLKSRGDLTPQEKILVVLGGGTKSLVNLDLICEVEKKYPFTEIKVIIVKEPVTIPPQMKLTRVLERAVKKLKTEVVGEVSIDCNDNVWNIRLTSSLNIARAMKFTSIALGITLDDQVINLVYGLIKGKNTFLPQSIGGLKVLTPLANIPLKEVLVYAICKKFPIFFSGCSEDKVAKLIAEFVYRIEETDPNVKYMMYRSLTRVIKALGRSRSLP